MMLRKLFLIYLALLYGVVYVLGKLLFDQLLYNDVSHLSFRLVRSAAVADIASYAIPMLAAAAACAPALSFAMHRERQPADQYEVDDIRNNLKDALEFLKDWVTSIIQIEMAILGGIGAAVVLKDRPDIHLTQLQLCDLLATASAFGSSICFGMTLLNMLPGAVQRVPKVGTSKSNDIYSITTLGPWRIYDWTVLFRLGFLMGLVGVATFVLLRVVQPPAPTPDDVRLELRPGLTTLVWNPPISFDIAGQDGSERRPR